MSADKLEALREALAEVFNESSLNATCTKTSHAAFDHKTLSEAFSESHLNVANPEQSFEGLEHAVLAGMFAEPSTVKPLPTSFDQSFADLLSQRPSLASDTHQPPPEFDQQGLAQILGELSTISANPKPAQPSFDHQALAEILTELRSDPVNPPTAPLGLDTKSSSPSAVNQIQPKELEARTFTAAARPPRAKSLFAKLHQVFSSKDEARLSEVDNAPLLLSLSGQQQRLEPMEKITSTPAGGSFPRSAKSLTELPPLSFEQGSAIATQSGNARSTKGVVATFTTDNASTWSPLTQRPHLTSKVTELPSPLKAERSQPILSGQSDFGAASTASESAGAREANSFSVELPPLNILENKIEPFIRQEIADPTLTRKPENLKSAAELAAAPQTNTQPARPQQGGSYLLEVPQLISTKVQPSLIKFQGDPSPPNPSGPLENTAPTASAITPFPATNTEDAPRQKLSWLSAKLPPMVSANREPPLAASQSTFSPQLMNLGPVLQTDPVGPLTESKSAEPAAGVVAAASLSDAQTRQDGSSFEQDKQSSSLSGQADCMGPPVNLVGASGAPEVESPRPQHISSLGAALRVLVAKPSRPILQKEASRSTPANPPDNAAMWVETASQPTGADSARTPQTKSLMTEMPAPTDAKSSAPIFKNKPSRPPISGQLSDAAPKAKTVAVAPPADMNGAVPQAQQAKSLLTELDMNTAIHLRWVMRDIRSERTKFSPISANDLTALVQLGLVEMREGLPMLSGLGLLALD